MTELTYDATPVESAFDNKASSLALTKALPTLMAIGLILLNLIVYLRVYNFNFVNWDDDKFILENIYYPQGLTPRTIWWALTSPEQGFWIPITRLSFLLDGHVWKIYDGNGWRLNPGGFHLTSLAIHLINTLLCFAVCRQMLGGIGKAFIVAAIFAVHPLHTESVCWINDRNDLLCGMFWLLGMLAYLWYCRSPRIGRYLVVLAIMSLSAMAKPLAATFPFAMLLLDYWPLGRMRFTALGKTPPADEPALMVTPTNEALSPPADEFPPRSLLGLALEKMPMIAIGIFFMAFTWYLKIDSDNVLSETTFPLSVRVANAIDSYAAYARQTVWPNDLRFFYPHPQVINHGAGIPLSQWGPALAILLAISGLAVYQVRRRPYLFVGWCWFLGILVPAIGLIQVGEYARADRYMYIPLLGLSIAIVMGVEALISRLELRKAVATLLSIVALLGLSKMAIRQAESWRNSEALYRQAVRVDAMNYPAYMNLGNLARQAKFKDEEHKRKNLELSLEYFEKARQIVPSYARPYNNMGISLVALGRVEEGLEAYQKALKCDPDYVLVYQNLGNYYFRIKKYDLAIVNYKEALKRKHRTNQFHLEQIHLKLASCYRKLGQESEALAHDREVYASNPNRLEALERIAWSLATSKDDAIRDSKEALELAQRLNEAIEIKSPVALDTLAAAYAAEGVFDQATKFAAEALELARAAKNEKLAKEIEDRYRLYLAGKPYRESEP
ncbi:MAG: tetratricopeptide repeat protein [Planctomycetaceae bacterium]